MKTTNRKSVVPLMGWIGLLLAPMACLQSAYAEDYSWRAATSGDFLGWDSWSPTGTPDDSEDRAIFDVSGEYTVYFDAPYYDPIIVNKRLDVGAGRVKFDLVYGDVVGGDVGVTYRLEPPTTWFTTAAAIGTTAGPQARLTVGGSDPFAAGMVEAEGALIIGQVPGSSGRLDIGDPDFFGIGSGHWTSTYPTYVGYNGTGLLVLDSGTLTDGGAVIGANEDVIGIATVTVNGDWTSHGSTTVGQNGYGILNLRGMTITDDDAYLARNAGSTGSVNSEKCTWSIGGNLYVGGDDEGAGGTATLNLTELGRITVAGETTIWPTGSVSIEGGEFECNGGLTTHTSAFEISGGELSVLNQLTASPGCEISLSGGTLNVGSFAGFDGDLLNWTAGEVNVTNDSLRIDDGQPLGADLEIIGHKSLSVSHGLNVGPHVHGTLTVASGGTVASDTGLVGNAFSGGSVALSDANTSWTTTDTLHVRGASAAQVSVTGGATLSSGTAFLADEAGTTAIVTLSGAETQWSCAGDLYIGGDELDSRGTSTIEVDGEAELSVTGTVKVWNDSVLEINGGRVATADLDIAGEAMVLNSGVLDVCGGMLDVDSGGTLNGAVVGDSWTDVALYDASTSWLMPGSLVIGAGDQGEGHVGGLTLADGTTVTVDENVTVLASSRLILAGGTINAAGFDVQDADFSDFGTINGEFTTTGSVTPTGDLMIGDVTSHSGVQIGGALTVGPHHVTINKQGLYFVGDSTSVAGGTLTAPNGIGLAAPDYLLGFGVIDTPDDPTKPLTNDGSILGNSASERFELTGYVEGLGFLDCVTISGTDDLGSVGPAGVDRGNVDYAGRLVIEIGGTIPGAEHDQINHSGAVGFGGELSVELLAGFEPGLGDSFTILTYASHAGEFDTFNLPPLATGLEWQINYGPSDLTLEIVGGGDPLVGDCDLDGDVDLSDLAQLLASYGMTDGATWGDGDFDGDSDVDLSDLAALLANYGEGL